MKITESIKSITLWLRGIQANLENLEESPLWKLLIEEIPNDYVKIPYRDHLGNCIGLTNDLANRFQELETRQRDESKNNYIATLSTSDIAGIATCCTYAIRENISLKSALDEMGFVGIDPNQVEDTGNDSDLITLAFFCLTQLSKQSQNDD